MDTFKALIDKTVTELDSSDPAVVIVGLNTLTSKSQELESGGVSLENYHELSIALSSLLDVINPLGCFYFMDEEDSIVEKSNGKSRSGDSNGSSSSSNEDQNRAAAVAGSGDDVSSEEDKVNLFLPSSNDAEFKVCTVQFVSLKSHDMPLLSKLETVH